MKNIINISILNFYKENTKHRVKKINIYNKIIYNNFNNNIIIYKFENVTKTYDVRKIISYCQKIVDALKWK